MSEEQASEAPPWRPVVLVVEDDPHIRGAIHDVLIEEGAVVIDRGTLGEGREAIGRSGQLDLALLDFALPDGEGTALCALLRSRGIPSLVISAHPRSLERMMEAHADAWIGKPFEIDDLIKAVRGLVAGRSSASAPSAS